MEYAEYKKKEAIDDLIRLKNWINSMIITCSNREIMDKQTHRNINKLYRVCSPIVEVEGMKELSKQKSEGKKFPSDEDIDKMIEDIKKEEGYGKD